MKRELLITFRSVTYAQRAQRVLQQKNIVSRLQRTPKALTTRGCGYCLRLQEREGLPGLEVLRREQVPYEKRYRIEADGTHRELTG